jgi:hypothetical protein
MDNTEDAMAGFTETMLEIMTDGMRSDITFGSNDIELRH